ncbi:MAG: hypothetical protein QN193_01055 [Armatimonadota bacterium]|nr:hypothetical protein [Armatimonadota bacterium]MDR7569178.1 hypothetical protein [Armatimonadota bacterium]MDR7613376.1 hypothetical protein [Armatimonadota bacterium]
MNYYACVGFAVRDAPDLARLAEEAVRVGVPVGRDPVLGLRMWCVGRGVELWAEVGPKGEALGVLPFYDSGRDHLLSVVGCGADPDHPEEGWAEAWINPTEAGEPYSGAFPLVCDLVDYLAVAPLLDSLPRLVQARLAVFLHEARIFPDALAVAEEALQAGFRLPPYTFASTPYFSLDEPVIPERPEATAMLSGRVLRVVQETNPHTGLPFLVLSVDTGKVIVDAVAPPDLLPGIREEMFLQAGGWVLAKIPALN